MFEGFKARLRNRSVVNGLYDQIVLQARQPLIYTDFAVPDTLMGRFEALCVHVFLFLNRCRSDPALSELAQDLVDRFIEDVEQSIREVGVSDPGVPKRMKKLAGMFYGRAAAYHPLLEAEDAAGLSVSLRKNAVAADAAEDAGDAFASYMIRMKRLYAAHPTGDILGGRLFDQA